MSSTRVVAALPTSRQATSRGRRRFTFTPIGLAVCLAGAAPATFGLPQGATTAFGQASVKQTQPGRLDIRQRSERAGLDWTSFSIGAGERVVVRQPGRSSVLLNRVLGDNPSLIYGRLQSNGGVWLINPRGIVFGASSRVDVGSLVASTLQITDEDLASGRLQLGRGSDEPGELRSEGVIRAPDGTVALISPRLMQSGRIEAGRIGLAAATEVLVDVEGDGLILFNARNDGLETRLSLLGNVLAHGGSVEARAVARAGFADTVLNLEGVVRARTLGQREGRIVVDGGADGITRLAGTLDATGAGAGERGGSVQLLGDKVLVDRGAVADASGSAGGGSVLVGGDYQGNNAEVRNASMVTVLPKARLAANATADGDGGRVIVWSDQTTRFLGQVEARGGERGGHGGFSEVSGKGLLDFRGLADLSAANGKSGTLLLDPFDLTVVSGSANAAELDGDVFAFDEGSQVGNSNIGSDDIRSLLATTDVTLQASRDITVNAAIPAPSGTENNSLTLQAGRDILVSQTIAVRGNLSFEANDAGSLDAGINAATTGRVTLDAIVTAGAGFAVNITNGATGTSTHIVAAAVNAGTISLTGTATLNSGAELNARVNVLRGTLNAGANGRIATTSRVDLDTGTTLALPDDNVVIGALSGSGTVVLDASNTFSVGDTTNTTFSGVIQGGNNASTVVKQGTGTLTLSGNNTYTGTTTVGGSGTLEINGTSTSAAIVVGSNATLTTNAANRLANAAAMTVDGALTLGGNDTVGTLSGAATGRVDLNTFTLTTGGNGSTIFAGIASDAGGLTKNGNGTLTLSGNNSYTGTTTVGGTGTLAVNGSLASPAVNVGAGATLSTNATNRLADSAALTVDGALTLGGNDTVGTLAGAATGRVDLNTFTLTTGGNGSTLFAGIASDAGGLTKNGSGTLTLSGNNTYTGTTTVGGTGTLAVNGTSASTAIVVGSNATLTTNAANRLADSAALTVDGALTLGGNDTVGTLAGAATGRVDLNTFTLTTAGNGSTTFAGIASDAGGLTKNGSGTLILSGANDYTGNTSVGGTGTLAISGSGAAGTGTLQVGSTATLDIVGAATVNNPITSAGGTIANSSGTGTIATGGVTLNADSTVSSGTGAGLDISAAITGTGGLTMAGSGTVTFSGNKAYTGDTTVGGTGTLAVNGNLASTVVSIGNGATLATNAADRLANGAALTVDGALSLGGNDTVGTLAGASTGRVDLDTFTLTTAGNGSTTFAGIASDAGGLTKNGSGTLTLSGNNTYTGITTVGGTGTLAVNGTSASAAIVVGSNATLTTNAANRLADSAALTIDGALSLGGNDTVGTLAGAATGRVDLNTFTLTTGGNGSTLFAGIASDAGGLTKNGSGTLTLSGDNTYTGTTTVGGSGTLEINGSSASTAVTVGAAATLSTDAADRLANAAALTVDGALTLGGNDTVGTLAGAATGRIDLVTFTLTTAGNGSTTFAGIASGTGGLTKNGSGTLILSGANDYTGNTSVGGTGTLAISGSGAAGTGTLQVGSTATLDIVGAATVNNPITSAGGTIANSSGTGTVATGGVTLNADSTVSSSAGAGLLISALVTGSGDLQKTGSGTVTLSAANDYTGDTTISQGRLALSGAGVAGSGALSIASAGTLDIVGGATVTNAVGSAGGTIDNSSGAGTLATGGLTLSADSTVSSSGDGLLISADVSGSGGLTKAGSGTVTLSGNKAYTGTTTVGGTGTLAVNGSLASTTIVVGNGATMTTDAADRFADNSALTVDGTLSLGGDDTVGTLAGASTGRVDLDTFTLTTAGNGSTTFAGIASDAGGLTKNGSGTLTLSGNNTYTGTTTVGGTGTLAVNGTSASAAIVVGSNATLTTNAANRLADSAALTIDGALSLGGNDTVGTLAGAATGRVDLNTFTLTTGGNGSTLFAGIASDAGGLTKNGSGTLTLSGANTYTGTTTVGGSGTLEINGSSASTAVTVGAAATLSTDAADRLANAAALTVDGALTLGGNDTVGTLAGAATGRIDLDTFTLTTTGNGSTTFAGIASGTGGLTKNGSGTLILSGANDYTGNTSVGGTGTLAVNGALASNSIEVGSGSTLSTDGADRLSDGATLVIDGTLALGGDDTVLSLAGAASGRLVLDASTLTLSGDASTTFAGNASGSGGMTKQGLGTFTLSGDNRHTGSTRVSGGTLVLDSSTALSDGTAVVLDDSAGVQLALNASVDIASLAGGGASGGDVTLGASTLTVHNGAGNPTTYDGQISGSGGLSKAGSGNFTLNGDQSYSGATAVSAGELSINGTSASALIDVSGGTLRVDGASLLATGADVTVGAAGTLTLGGNNRVATLALSGLLDGNFRLTADTYALSGGRADANLGDGTLTSSGTSALNGNAATSSITVTGGTLSLGSGVALTGNPSLVVDGGATLTLVSDVSLGSGTLDLAGTSTLTATLNGSGVLSADRYTLNHATVAQGAGLGVGTLSSTGNSTLSGTADALDVTVASGTLRLTVAGAEHLSNAADVTVAAGATLTVDADETIGRLSLSGTLGGVGLLSASSYVLQDAVATSDIGGGELTSRGLSTLQGRFLGVTLRVETGTLTLASSGRLANRPDVAISADATLLLALAGTETVSSLTGDGTANLRTSTLTIDATTASSFAGVLSGSGNLVKEGARTVTLSNDSTYTGTTTVNAGTLRLNAGASLASAVVNVEAGTLELGTSNQLANGAALDVADGATLTLAGNDSVASLALAGTLNGSGTLTAATYALDGGSVALDANLGSGTLNTSGNSTLTGSAAADTVNVTGGRLSLASAGRLTAAPDVNVGGTLELGGAETFGTLSGSGSVNLGSHTLSSGSGGASTFAGVLSGTGGQLLKQGQATFTLSGANTYTGSTTVADGTLSLTGTLASASVDVQTGATLVLGSANRLANGADLGVAQDATLTLTGAETVASLVLDGTLDGSGTLTAATYSLDGGSVALDANLGTGTLNASGNSTLTGSAAAGTVNVDGGTLTLASAGRLSATPIVVVDRGATLALGGAETAASLALAGTLGGSGTLTAASYSLDGGSVALDANLGTGTLNVSGDSRLAGQAAVGTVNVDDGTLTLASAGRLSAAPSISVDSGATLALGGNETAGRLQGAGDVELGSATLSTGAAGPSTFSGALSGTGSLRKLGTSTFTLSGANTYTGSTTVADGTLVLDGTLASGVVDVEAGARLTLGSAHRLADDADLSVADSARLTLAGDDTVATLALAGTLDGTGTLTAATYTLNGGSVALNANLGTGTLDSSGNSTLAGTAAAGTVNVVGGTLTLGSAHRLADDADVSVADGATLTLAGNDSVASLALAGTLNGSGTLTAATYALDGGSVALDANLGSGTLNTSGNSTLTGSAAADTVNVTGGRLSLASAGRLTAAPDVNVGGTLELGGAETFGTLSGSGSVNLGSHTLSSGSGGASTFAGVLSGTGGQLLKQGQATFTLSGANTYTGSTTVADGTLSLTGTLASASVDVQTGATLVLGSANRLANGADLGVAQDATLTLTGAETVASLVLDGTLDGSGTLTAATYSLDGGSVALDANLGTGTLNASGNSTLTGSAAAGTVNVDGGTLTLASAGRLSATPIVVVDRGATLALGGAETAASLALAGTLGGSGTLTAASYSLDGGSVALDANLGTGTLNVSGDSRLAGQAAVGTVNVDDGTLTLASAGRLSAAPSISVDSGATLALGGNETAGRLQGAGDVELGSATLSTGAAGPSTFSGALSGTGSLRKLGTSTFTLSGANTYTGSTTVADGTLVLDGTLASGVVDVEAGARLTLGSAHRLADDADLSVADSARLTLAGDDTVATLALAGTLDGTGTLTAATYTLNGGSVALNANLGTGTLDSSGNSTLAGTAAAGTVNVVGGTLTLASAGRLAAAPSITVGDGATLALGGNETAGLLQGSGSVALGSATLRTGAAGSSTFSGVLSGTGGLRKLGAGTFTLSGDHSYTGDTTVAEGTLALDGSLASGSVGVDGRSRLVLGSADRLADGAAVTVANGATLILAGTDTVASLVLDGTLNGTGTLSAATYRLNGGSVAMDAQLGAGALRSSGDSRLTGSAAADTVQVIGGTLSLTEGGRFTAEPVVDVDGGATLALGGNETFGSLAGAGSVTLGTATLTTGAAGSTTFSGAISGEGQLVKRGETRFTLTGSNLYTGLTTVEAGTLRLGAGGALATTEFKVDGLLQLALPGDLTLAQPISGMGGVEQAGNGTLTMAGNNKTYDGETRVSSGSLATANRDALPDGSNVTVAAGTTLLLGGRETVGSIDAQGAVRLGGDFGTAGNMLLGGVVSVAGNRAVTLTNSLPGARIVAVNDGNQWGSSLSIDSRGSVRIASGQEPASGAGDGGLRDLVLGSVTIDDGGTGAAGSRIDAGLLTLDGLLTLGSGQLQLVSDAKPAVDKPTDDMAGRTAGGLQVAFASEVILQNPGNPGSRIDVAAGASLSVVSTQGGSIQLNAADNRFAGTLTVLSGPQANSAWDFNPRSAKYAVQSRVLISGTQVLIGPSTVNVGGEDQSIGGIEADVVSIRADSLATTASTATAARGVIVARLPYDNNVGADFSVAGLTLELTPASFGLAFPFGQGGSEREIQIDVGSSAFGGRDEGLSAGYLQVLPRGAAQGSTAVILTGPALGGGYQFFFDGAGQQTEIPVFYNGVLPVTPQVSGSISATVAVSESARRERFEEAVRTENVATRLRQGVIAEVGPGRPATQGGEGARPPDTCPPTPGALDCPPPR